MKLPDQSIQQLFSTGSVALVGWRNQPGWPIEFASESVSGILGYEPAQLADGAVNFADLVHPDDIDKVCGARRKDDASQFQPDDYRVKTADGGWRWIQSSVTIERGDDGAVTRYFGYLLDVTERRRTEEQLESQRKRLELVIQGTRLGMWDWNPQTNEVAFNAMWAEMLGHDFSEIESNLSEWESRVHPDDLSGCYADIQAHIDGTVPFYENVHRMRHKDGSWVYILDRGQIMERDEQGRPTRFTGTHTDITKE